ncbi:MAG: 50S ribosomal protein L3 N(5)-glutamine methyltransferase [Xanthomonadales bacterium]|nr:50S ribosomal protein L3 N(5)-glutamine methyltransferase [Xanthomonadales bacterium]
MGKESIEIWVRRCAARMDEAGLFFGHGTDNAWDEAAWLVLHALGLDPGASFERWDLPVSREDAVAIEALLQRRIETRQPLAYLVGEAWFAGLRFKAAPGALVPRSPIAELILNGFQPWLTEPPQRALDLCTGSGCIAVAMAHWMPTLEVDGTDISETALDIAAANVRMHGLEDRVHLVRADLFDGLESEAYDLLVTNPPYVPVKRLAELPAEYLAEPSLGLVSGSDGLDLPLRILRDAPRVMRPGAVLFCEVGESEGALQRVLNRVPLTWLEFERGGGGVFTMNREELLAARPDVDAVLEQRVHVT